MWRLWVGTAMKRILVGVVLLSLAVSHCPTSLAQEPATEPISTVEEELRKLREAGIPTTFEDLGLPDIPDDENGAFVYREAFDRLDALSEKYKAEWDYIPYVGNVEWAELPPEKKKTITNLVLCSADFSAVHELLEKASPMQCAFLSKEAYGKDRGSIKLLPHLEKLRGCTRLLAAKAQLEAENGHIDAALGTVLTYIRAAKCLSSEPFILSQIVRMALDGIALYNLEEVLKHGQGSIPLYQSLVDEIRDERRSNLLQRALNGEIVVFGVPWFSGSDHWDMKLSEKQIREMVEFRREYLGERVNLAAILKIFREEGSKKFVQEEGRIYFHSLSKLSYLAGLDYWEAREELERFPEELERLPNNAGRGYFTRATAPLARICAAEARLDAALGAAEIALALRIYKAKHRFYPFRLGELVPEIIPELPKDPYTGKDYVYNPKGVNILIYSVGPNLKDDLGVSHIGKRPQDDYDIVWKLSYF